MADKSKERTSNRLAEQKSPYLLQHAQNPVDWYPWGDEAFAAAKAANKPIFLSVGYSTCHWCHVMERESFENHETAALMNELFINIKVDREERPDVDRVYMAYVQATTGSGGWPMSVWLTPELKPYFGGTYFPPDGAYGRPGFPTVLDQLARAWRDRRQDVIDSADDVLSKLADAISARDEPQALSAETLESGYRRFKSQYDPRQGGFGGAPKFPRPVTHNFLLRYFAREEKSDAAQMVTHTLRQMSAGGMYDHLGGGYHRYSVDGRWHVPHFEKMLYDQAQLAISLIEAHQVGGDNLFAERAKATLDYVLRDLHDEKTNAFYSAEDADSPIPQKTDEQAEGAFYVWTKAELEGHLGEEADLFCAAYGVKRDGNAIDPHGELAGKNVLHEIDDLEALAETRKIDIDELQRRLAAARATLFSERETRPRPHLDDKIICSWNGMIISALARAARAFGSTTYLQAAQRAASFITGELFDEDEGLLYRRYSRGERAFEAYLEDYAELCSALIELYQADLDARWLKQAEVLADRAIALFGDGEQGAFFSTSGRDPSVLLRIKDEYDGAEPSGNSVLTAALLRLAALGGRQDFEAIARKSLDYFSARLTDSPTIAPQMLVAFELAHFPIGVLMIAGENDDAGFEELKSAFDRGFYPRVLVARADEQFKRSYGDRLPQIIEMKSDAGQARAYLCEGQRCQEPTTDPKRLAEQLAS